MADVRYDTDDGGWNLLRRDEKALPDGVLAGPILARKRAIDDGGWRRIEHVRIKKVTAGEKARAESSEVFRRNDRVVDDGIAVIFEGLAADDDGHAGFGGAAHGHIFADGSGFDAGDGTEKRQGSLIKTRNAIAVGITGRGQ